MASIYSVADWSQGGLYPKHSIVKYNNFYYYAANDHVASLSFDADYASGLWNGKYIDEFGNLKAFFQWASSYGTNIESQPKTKIVKFGDGYEQRIKDGINNNLIRIKLDFSLRGEMESAAILHFLYARQSVESFIYIPHSPYSTPARFVARAWTDNKVFFNNHTIQVEFEQVVN